ncbi:hypothetical protein ASPVEDRAFT_53620 [Aspergillus versicolor CBS 583.65]|uniref:Condensation domain-containing protein n=1 Tax=Aspergillus versicolor CBS 583.65 TaxID=1036611 RepID=A0A1L9PNI0_ASPVE|nr:uncharacterized protein ASPVEDRAFT_53620 [Aspergillus versicolor CBS 583.65]OJJ03084.1 hypothetical protein ASPVEDRAFT_53620 [Aspergillus versicolor CBS 583.65]
MGLLDTSDYSWTQVRPGRWERNIDESEQFYTTLAKTYEASGRCCFAITAYVSFSVQGAEHEVELALRKAWLRLRYESPTVASWVEYSEQRQRCRKIYDTAPTPEAQNAWLESTFQVVRTRMSGLQWCNSDPPVPDIPTLFMIKRAGRSSPTVSADVVLRCRHDVMDGAGALMLLNSLFVHAAQALDQGDGYRLPDFGDEYARLSPPFRIAAGVPPGLSKKQHSRLNKTISMNAALKEVEIAGFPRRKGATQPGKHQRVAITLSTESTYRLVKACKALGLSVTHAYHTAIGIVLRDLQRRQSRPRTVRYINYCLMDERPQCEEPYNTPAHAASVYHSVSGECLAVDLTVPAASFGALDQVLDYSIPRRNEYMKVASAVRRFDIQNRNDKQRVQMVPSYWGMITPPYPADNAAPALPPPYNKPSVSLSDLGTLDNTISPSQGAFQLDNPWVTREHLVTGLALFLGIWDGRLTLSATYNDAWHTRNEALAFLDRCNVVSLQALGA